MNISYILQNIPFLNHLTDSEIQTLCESAEIKPVSKNEKIDIKKIHSFGAVVEGIFELGQRIRGDRLYLAPGSFFGEIPFAVSHHAGTIKAVKDSLVMMINPEKMYKSLLSSYKGFKGYIRNIKGNGFDIIDSGNDFLKRGSRVITVFGRHYNSGGTMLASLLGLNLSGHGSVIILDASSEGNSIFNFFQKEMPPAVSQKAEKGASDEKFVYDRVVNISENLSLLNLYSGSKIKINPDILSPVIFILSRKYKYIIIDHSDYRKDFTNRIFEISDILFPVIKNIKDKSILHNILDSDLKDGQRVYYVLNRFYEKTIGTFEGGYILEDLDFNRKENLITNLKNILESNKPKFLEELTEHITRERTGLTIQTNLTNSVFLAGFFSSLYEKDIKIDTIYSSSWSYLITVLYILNADNNAFENNFLKLFTEDKIKSLLDVTFPDEHVYKNGRINNYADELAGDKRIEHYSMLPVAMLTDRGSGCRRMFSTGFVRDLFTASFLLNIFEPKNIADSYYCSGYPSYYVKPEDLLRTDINKIRSVIINNKQKLSFGETKISKFFKGYADSLDSGYIYPAFTKSKNELSINVNTDKYNVKEILELSKDICKDMK
ncbi:MAG: hypothetical protein JXN64_13430 [Spirochaetes bacterium]|nr:hypothetical protein [Spirochaetota bacterium]